MPSSDVAAEGNLRGRDHKLLVDDAVCTTHGQQLVYALEVGREVLVKDEDVIYDLHTIRDAL